MAELRSGELAPASDSGAVDTAETDSLSTIARSAVPDIADLCVIDLVEPDGSLRRATVAHSRPDRESEVADFLLEWPPDPDGEHPAARAVRTGEPQLGPTIPPGLLEKTTACSEHLEIVRSLGFESFLTVPLTGRERTLGAITLVSRKPEHRFEADDIGMAMALARSVASSLETTRLMTDKDEALSLLESVLEAVPAGLGFIAPSLRVVRINPALALMTGRAAEEAVGQQLSSSLGTLGGQIVESVRSALEAGEAVPEVEVTAEPSPATTRRAVRHFAVGCFPVRSRAGDVMFAGITVRDLTDRYRSEKERRELLERERHARSAAEEATERVALLAAATALLSESANIGEGLSRLAHLVVPALGDWCAVDLVEDGDISNVAVAHVPRRGEVLEELAGAEVVRATCREPVATVVRTGEPVLLSDAGEDPAGRSAGGLEVYPGLGRGPALVVPIRGRAREVVGAVSIGLSGPGRPLGEPELHLASELAHRAGLAIDRAHLREREHRLAVTFQRMLLPDRQPHVPGVATAARYLAATAETQVGGDWYDVLPLDDGRIRVVIGDVMGHDTRAAASMATFREALRAYSWIDPRPVSVLARLDSFIESMGQHVPASVFYALFDPVRRTMRWSSAGHPPPLLLAPDRDARFIGRPGSPMVGWGIGAAFAEESMVLDEGETVVLFTDGLVERRGMPIDDGLDRLAAVGAQHSRDDPETLLDALEAGLFDDGQRGDDVAILAMRVV